MLGQVLLGKYKIIRQLDEGGMSKIYLARQTNPDRDVVVKVLKEHLRTQTKAVEHFRREIHIMTRLEHPNAVATYDALPRDLRGPILIMEYLRGTDLAGLMPQGQRFSTDRAGRLLVQLCDVLHYCHQSGVIHRDLKPGNVMILYPNTPQETVKLMDFGLAKMSNMLYISPDEIVDWNLPAASGTPEYISPEMVRGNDMDARGDLYSVGVILYELLAGRRPFTYSGVEKLMLAHAHEAPPMFTDLGITDIPPAVEAVVRSCLEKYPEKRPANALELADAYQRAVGKRLGSTSRMGGNSGLVMRPALPAHRPDPRIGDRSAIRQTVEASMPEALALVKVKGFIYDLGGEVVESVPGMIKVQLVEKKKSSGSGWFAALRGGTSTTSKSANSGTDLELHLERLDPNDTAKLTITLVMRPLNGQVSVEWRNRAEAIGRDLQAYLMGR
jgi:serine/threonine-protein kinase